MSSSLPQEETVEANARAGIPPGRFQRTFSALRYRDFRLLWFGAFASTTGTFMQTLAQGWLVYTMTGSALLLGVDGFLATGPMLLFSLFGGVIADRMERRKIMMLSQVLQGSFALILAALIYFHTVKIWHIFILSFLTGSAQSISGPAYASLLPLLVKREDMANAVAMNSMQFNLARVIGPALGGVVFGIWGATACFGINGLSFGFVIIALTMIKMPPLQAGATSASMMAQMKEGFA
ncbi:MAG TPA: MFS transporter, partial [Thermoanaerobaculia bacterium]